MGGVQQRHTTARHDAFLNAGARCGERVFHAVLLFLELGLGSGADADDGYAASQLGQTLLQLFTVVLGGDFLDLALELVEAGLHGRFLAATLDDGGVVLVGHHAAGTTQVFKDYAVQTATPCPRRSPCRRFTTATSCSISLRRSP